MCGALNPGRSRERKRAVGRVICLQTPYLGARPSPVGALDSSPFDLFPRARAVGYLLSPLTGLTFISSDLRPISICGASRQACRVGNCSDFSKAETTLGSADVDARATAWLKTDFELALMGLRVAS
jgi:hypothetical protein